MLRVGDVLDNMYEIKSQIGSGGGGIIYKGYHLRMRIPVAIKLMKNEARGIIDQRSEVDLLKQLKNDYIPQVLDFIIDGNDVYTVMEFVEGSNFKQLISSGRTFSEKDVLRYTKQLCTAVKYLHDHNPPIIHSDIKPANIMLKPDDTICLIDFNISTVVSENGAYSVGGSKGFAAPEQFRKVIDIPVDVDEFHEETRFLGMDDETEFIDDSLSGSSLKTKNVSKAYVDIRTDIYGIGSSMYYMLTGRVPLTGKTDFRGVKVSSKTQKIIKKCMNSDPAKRYANVRELENALTSKGTGTVLAAVAAVLIICTGAVIAVNNNSSSKMETEDFVDNTGKTINFDDETGTVTTERTSKNTEEVTTTTPFDTLAAAVSMTTTSKITTTAVTTTPKVTTTAVTTTPKVTTPAVTTTPKVTTAAVTTTPKVTTPAVTTTPKVTTAAVTTTPKVTTAASNFKNYYDTLYYSDYTCLNTRKKGDYFTVDVPADLQYDEICCEMYYIDDYDGTIMYCGYNNLNSNGKKIKYSYNKDQDGSIIMEFDNRWLCFDGGYAYVIPLYNNKVAVPCRINRSDDWDCFAFVDILQNGRCNFDYIADTDGTEITFNDIYSTDLVYYCIPDENSDISSGYFGWYDDGNWKISAATDISFMNIDEGLDYIYGYTFRDSGGNVLAQSAWIKRTFN